MSLVIWLLAVGSFHNILLDGSEFLDDKLWGKSKKDLFNLTNID